MFLTKNVSGFAHTEIHDKTLIPMFSQEGFLSLSQDPRVLHYLGFRLNGLLAQQAFLNPRGAHEAGSHMTTRTVQGIPSCIRTDHALVVFLVFHWLILRRRTGTSHLVVRNLITKEEYSNINDFYISWCYTLS